MNLIWRLIWTLLFSRFSSPVNLLSESNLTFCALPTDIDVLLHLNNGRYFSLTDIARLDFMIRNKTFPILNKNRIYPVIASEMMRFKKSIGLFKRFSVTTRIAGWDDKFFYLIHYFKQAQEVHALGVVKARFLKKSGGPINPQAVLALLNLPLTSPTMPAWIAEWNQADQHFYQETGE